jgi:hypothetical protein
MVPSSSYQDFLRSSAKATEHKPKLPMPSAFNSVPSQEPSSPSQLTEEYKQSEIDLMRIFEGKDDLLEMLRRDKDFYEGQDKKMRNKIKTLCRQLDETQNEALKCKPLLILGLL